MYVCMYVYYSWEVQFYKACVCVCVGLALKNQSSLDNPVILAIERYWMTSCKSRL